mgnify:CR=1 FL=1
MKQNKSLAKIVKEVGSVSELAKQLGVSQPCVSNWLSGKRQIPATKVKLLVELSNGKVSEEDLRPDVFCKPKRK